jgi:hydroxymethylpyrimidine pyrophosphatase-like HAD family hydrolase
MKTQCTFIGDSPNDEPMFGFFPKAVAVANIREFLAELKDKPAFITEGEEAEGFCELAARLLKTGR